jgi:hypothetical protein
MGKNSLHIVKNFGTAQAGQKVQAKLECDVTYDNLYIIYENSEGPADKEAFLADIETVRLNLEGDDKWNIPSKILIDYLDRYKIPYGNGVFPLPFAKTNLRTLSGENSLSIGTQDVDKFFVELAISKSAVNPELDLYADVSAQSPRGQIMTLKVFENELYTANELVPITKPVAMKHNTLLVAMHCLKNDIDEIKVETGMETGANKTAFHATKELNEIRNSFYGRAKIPDVFSIDFCRENTLTTAMPLCMPFFDMHVKAKTKGRLPVFAEIIEG